MKKGISIAHLNGVDAEYSLEDMGCKIIYTTSLGCSSELCHETRSNPITLRYVICGEENLVRDNQKGHKVKDDQFLLINEGQKLNRIISRPGSISLVVLLSQDLIYDVLQTYRCSTSDSIDKITFEELVWSAKLSGLGNLLRQIKDRAVVRDSDAENGVQALISALIIELNKHAQYELHTIQKIKAAKYITRLELYKKIHMAREYIHENLFRFIALEELSEVASISKFHFLRLFHTTYGEAPLKYLHRLRLQKAYELLSCKTYTVTEVASLLKFSDLSYFSNCFKNYHGVRPSHLLT